MSDLRGEAEGKERGPAALERKKPKVDWSDPEARRAYNRRWREAHPDYNRKVYQRLRAENPEKLNERSKRYYWANREKHREYLRRRKYGLERAEFDRLLIEQGGKCAICRVQDKLCVDHNHETLDVRGLLCSNCNTGIGMLGDSIESLERALEYMRQWRKREK